MHIHWSDSHDQVEIMINYEVQYGAEGAVRQSLSS